METSIYANATKIVSKYEKVSDSEAKMTVTQRFSGNNLEKYEGDSTKIEAYRFLVG